MMAAPLPIDWSHIRLVVFDMDGTLYNQSHVRVRMARDLLWNVGKSRSLHTIRCLRYYRMLHERMGDEYHEAFQETLLERVAFAMNTSPDHVEQLVHEWLLQRPLKYVYSGRYPGVMQVFETLRMLGKKIAVWSDYPVKEKMQALGLQADYCVWAGDAGINALKPNPRGLRCVMEQAHCSPSETVMIGDRIDRDGVAAEQAGTAFLLRGKTSNPDVASFTSYRDLALSLETH